MRARDAVLCSLVVALGATSCEDDSLSEIHPRILVCPAEDAPDEDCNRAFDLGERFVTVEHRVPLFVRNRGQAPLAVRSMAASVEWADVEPSSLFVDINGEEPVDVRLTPEDIGEQEIILLFANDDPERPSLQVPLRFVGTPKPVPVLELCVMNAGPETCGHDLDVDFGVVRRTQRESRTLSVRNVGTDVLRIEEVVVSDRSSQPGELHVATSTRAGALEPGEQALMLVVYEPVDGERDELTLTFVTDDPSAAEARVVFFAESERNMPPVALAEELESGLGSVEATVGDLVVLDGAASRDPEGDPLVYEWTLTLPANSLATLDDPAAGRVSFVPDVAGSYRAELVVYDSLEQRSEVPSLVLVQAIPEAALRVRLSWEQGGDVDLHLVPVGDSLFSPTDAYFENPRPDLGAAGDAADDPELLHDAEASPGVENLVFVAPPAGTFRIYAHYYDEGGEGAAVVRVAVTLNDASFPVLDNTRTLQSGCALWHVGDVEFPGGLVSNTGAGVSSLCP